MSTRIVDIINSSCRFNSYLELGVYDSKNFNAIICDYKESVDVCGEPTHKCTTDEFFTNNSKSFDIVFIDADHRLESVVKDFNNSISITKQMIFLHDMFPPCESFCSDLYCGDSYKLLGYFLNENINFTILNEDCGLCVIFKNEFRYIDKEKIENMSYSDLLNKKIYRCSVEEMEANIRGFYEK